MRREAGRVFVQVEVASEPTSEVGDGSSEPTHSAKIGDSELTSELLQQIQTQHLFLSDQFNRVQETLQKSNDDLRKKDEELAYTRRQLDAVTGFLVASLVHQDRLPKSSEVSSELFVDSEPSENEQYTEESHSMGDDEDHPTSEVGKVADTPPVMGRSVTIRGGKRSGRLQLAWKVLTGQIDLPA